MIAADGKVIQMINATARKIDARVELYEGSPSVDEYNKTLISIFKKSDALKDFSIERIGEQSKFFGFGICQKLTVTLIDKDRQINVEKGQIIEVALGVEDAVNYPCPLFRIDTVTRDENNNDIKIIAYDFLYKAGEHRTSEITEKSYTIREYVYMCANLLGLPVKFAVDTADEYIFDEVYPASANFEGNETIRQALNAVADATQTIYFVDWDWQLTFKRLNKDALPVTTIDKSQYFSLANKGRVTLGTICHATELGDNVSAEKCEGVTQYIRDNAFWELRDDIGVLLNRAIDAVGGMSMYQINLNWRGNWLVEIGDKFSMMTKDNLLIEGYLLNDTITYNGGYKQVTTWSFTENSAESASNPVTIGDAINQTVARVDKVNKQIELVVSETGNHSDRISQLEMTTDEINASVTRVENNVNTSIDGVNETIGEIRNEVEMKMTSTDVTILIEEAITTGIDSVTTSTGFTFDAAGLTIDKSNSELSTQITEDGMTVYRNSTPVLVANNQGVDAINLHATTYLIIGDKSRFENYGSRTGCFWIGE